MKDLLLEIGTEEVPAHAMIGILNELRENAAAKLKDLRLDFSDIRTLGTPRRLTLMVSGLAERQTDISVESKGPSLKIACDEEGNFTKAALGFARGKKIAPEQLIKRDGYIYAVVEEKGADTASLLPDFLNDLVTTLSFPNSMRWADYSFRFIRPLRWLVALYGDTEIKFTVAGVTSSRTSRGHRFLSDGDFVINNAAEYEQRCEKNFVIVDQNKRRDIIRRQIEKIAADNHGQADITEDLLEEVLFLVEYPTALCGSFDEKYLRLPTAAVITPMRDHQRYFPVWSKDHKLMPLFITVRNGGSDFIDTVRHGNERVLKARLEDAEFFFNEDRKKSLAEHRNRLKTLVYQEGLGTVYDKSERLKKLAALIAYAVRANDEEKSDAIRAAELAKADLVTNMVTEFTELQGVMGREYALADGEKQAVATAIYEHYMPRSASDSQPQTTAGRIVSIADKIDALTGMFSLGKIPTGSQDPFALRRQALGMVRTLVEARWSLDLDRLFSAALDLYGIEAEKREKIRVAVADFLRLRLKNVLNDAAIRYDAADAVLTAVNNPYRVYQRALAVNDIVEKDCAKVVQAFVRVGNIAQKAESAEFDEGILKTDAEQKLLTTFKTAHQQAVEHMDNAEYRAAIDDLSALVEPIDEFFAAVMVMDEDLNIRRSRLGLLKSIDDTLRNIADFDKIVVQ